MAGRHSPAQGPDTNIIGGNLDNGGQEEIQVHVSTKCRSAEWNSIIHQGVYKPVQEK